MGGGGDFHKIWMDFHDAVWIQAVVMGALRAICSITPLNPRQTNHLKWCPLRNSTASRSWVASNRGPTWLSKRPKAFDLTFKSAMCSTYRSNGAEQSSERLVLFGGHSIYKANTLLCFIAVLFSRKMNVSYSFRRRPPTKSLQIRLCYYTASMSASTEILKTHCVRNSPLPERA